MNKCDSWRSTGNHSYCIGTKECEPCECGGDMSRCDFYENVRSAAKKAINSPADIKAGYLLVLRTLEGEEYNVTVVPCGTSETLGCCGERRWFMLDQVNDDFIRTLSSNSTHEVVKVYGCTNSLRLLSNSTKDRKLLWQRKKKMTVEEIGNILGYPIEVIENAEQQAKKTMINHWPDLT